MSGDRQHLHATIRGYVQSRDLAENYDEYFSETPLFSYDCRFLEKTLELPRSGTGEFSVLDLGCGTGRHLIFLRKNRCRAAGIDLNPHMLEKARLNLRREGIAFSGNPSPGGAVRLLEGDFHNLPFDPEERFDAVVMMFSTLGLVNTARLRLELLRSLKSRLAENGVLILHVHNEKRCLALSPPLSLSKLGEFARRKFGRMEEGDHIQPNYRGVMDIYLHFFTIAELEQLVAAAGYDLIELLPLNERRDGPYAGKNADRFANGFLVAARKR